jgi:hypothetical protein
LDDPGRAGAKGQVYRLLTTILDPERAPAPELAAWNAGQVSVLRPCACATRSWNGAHCGYLPALERRRRQ